MWQLHNAIVCYTMLPFGSVWWGADLTSHIHQWPDQSTFIQDQSSHEKSLMRLRHSSNRPKIHCFCLQIQNILQHRQPGNSALKPMSKSSEKGSGESSQRKRLTTRKCFLLKLNRKLWWTGLCFLAWQVSQSVNAVFSPRWGLSWRPKGWQSLRRVFCQHGFKKFLNDHADVLNNTVNEYFEELNCMLKENDIPWEHVYNMDEKGCQMGGGRKDSQCRYIFSQSDVKMLAA